MENRNNRVVSNLNRNSFLYFARVGFWHWNVDYNCQRDGLARKIGEPHFMLRPWIVPNRCCFVCQVLPGNSSAENSADEDMNNESTDTSKRKSSTMSKYTCQCKKSGCKTNQCACRKGGRTCGEACKCVGCHNAGPETHSVMTQWSPRDTSRYFDQ